MSNKLGCTITNGQTYDYIPLLLCDLSPSKCLKWSAKQRLVQQSNAVNGKNITEDVDSLVFSCLITP